MKWPFVYRRRYEFVCHVLDDVARTLEDKRAEIRRLNCELATYKKEWAKVLLDNAEPAANRKS